MSPQDDPYLPSDTPRSRREMQSTRDGPHLRWPGQGQTPGIGKCWSQHFTLHKLIVLPTQILENKFIAYEHYYDYLALSFNQRDFALLKEADLKSCIYGHSHRVPNQCSS